MSQARKLSARTDNAEMRIQLRVLNRDAGWVDAAEGAR
jgi:hypothetical protein